MVLLQYQKIKRNIKVILKNRKKYQHVYCANDGKNGEQIQNFLATIMACNSEILTYHKIKALNRLHQLNAVACIEKYNFTSEVLN